MRRTGLSDSALARRARTDRGQRSAAQSWGGPAGKRPKKTANATDGCQPGRVLPDEGNVRNPRVESWRIVIHRRSLEIRLIIDGPLHRRSSWGDLSLRVGNQSRPLHGLLCAPALPEDERARIDVRGSD